MRLMRTSNTGGVAIGQTNREPVTASHYNVVSSLGTSEASGLCSVHYTFLNKLI